MLNGGIRSRQYTAAIVFFFLLAALVARADEPVPAPPAATSDQRDEEPEPAEPLWAVPANAAWIGDNGPYVLPPANLCSKAQTIAVCIGRSCELRRLSDGVLIRTIGPCEFDAGAAVLSPDGRLLACIQDTTKAYRRVPNSTGIGLYRDEPIKPERDIHVVYLWATETGKLLFRLRQHSTSVAQLVFSPNDHRLLSFAVGNHACLWDTATGELLARLDGPLPPFHARTFYGATWARFHRDGLTVAGPNELVEFDDNGDRQYGWPLASAPNEYLDFGERHCELAISKEGVLAMTRILAPDNPVFWNQWQAANAPLPVKKDKPGDTPVWYESQPLCLSRKYSPAVLDRANSYRHLEFSPDGLLLASTRIPPSWGKTNDLVLWDVKSGKQVFGPPAAASKLTPSEWYTTGYVFSPDGKWLLYGTDKTRFFNVKTFKWFRPRHEVQIADVKQSPNPQGGRFQISSDGQHLLGAGCGGEIRVWRLPPILGDLVEISGPLAPENK